MKILYLHQHFALRSGSAGTRSFEFARLLASRGHEVTVVCGRSYRSGLPQLERGLIHKFERSGFHIWQLNVDYDQKMGFTKRILVFIWFMLLSSWVACFKRDVDVVYAASTPLTIAVPALMASFLRGRKFVFEVRDLWPEIPIGLGVLRNPLLIFVARQLERLAYRRAEHVVALSPGMKEGVMRQGIPAGKVSTIPNSSDNDLFDVPASAGVAFREKHKLPLDLPLVVYTGAFGRVNELSYLVHLADWIKRRGERVGFLLVGAGREFRPVKQLARELGLLNECVWLMEAMPRQEIPVVLSAATVMTSTVTDNPVLWHNSANKFFDALAASRPMVINHCGWQADLLEETGAGLALHATDIEAAADALLAVIFDEVWLAKAGASARQLAETRFDRVKLSYKLETILQEAIKTS